MQYIRRGHLNPITEGPYAGLCSEKVVVAFDKATELTTGTQKVKFAPYSLAWVLETGDIYALSEADEWVLQPHAQIIL